MYSYKNLGGCVNYGCCLGGITNEGDILIPEQEST